MQVGVAGPRARATQEMSAVAMTALGGGLLGSVVLPHELGWRTCGTCHNATDGGSLGLGVTQAGAPGATLLPWCWWCKLTQHDADECIKHAGATRCGPPCTDGHKLTTQLNKVQMHGMGAMPVWLDA